MARYIIPLIVVVVVIYFLLPGGDDPSEIEAVFNEIMEAANKKDVEGVTEHFSLHYKDEYGLSYPVIKHIIKNKFELFDGIDGKYSGLSVSINENEDGNKQAVANVSAVVYGEKSGIPRALFGSDEAPENITVILEKSTFGDWKIKEVSGVDSGNYDY